MMLVACEVAVEYWMALTWSPQVEWMREAQHAGALQVRGGGGHHAYVTNGCTGVKQHCRGGG